MGVFQQFSPRSGDFFFQQFFSNFRREAAEIFFSTFSAVFAAKRRIFSAISAFFSTFSENFSNFQHFFSELFFSAIFAAKRRIFFSNFSAICCRAPFFSNFIKTFKKTLVTTTQEQFQNAKPAPKYQDGSNTAFLKLPIHRITNQNGSFCCMDYTDSHRNYSKKKF